MHAVEDSSLPNLVTVGCANFESVPRDKAATLEKLLATMRDAARQGCQLVVFPELALNTWGVCGDCARRHRPCSWHLDQAEPAPGPAADAVAALARELDLHVIYGFEERDEEEAGVVYNAAAMIAPDGLLGTYRKLHLGIPLETDRFTPGKTLPVFETRIGPIGIQICYDFYNNPELSRILALKGARLLVNPTGRSDLPRGGENLRHATLVRAQENLVYAASANRVGAHDDARWAGNSVIAGPAFPGFGRVLAEAGRGEELVVATLNFRQLAAWHDWLPWREWRLGPQLPVTRLVAEEWAALVAKAEH
ncbi:MAG: carbon-nitrogen hydrolase family protein [Proteobacteria bacterium]|nr:carbon-nitrogen hydrolase family protein [Pseudomonadota bacterium]